MMRLGSPMWWLRHELRLELRQMALDSGPIGIWINASVIALAYFAAHAVAWVLVGIDDASAKDGISLDGILFIAVWAACAFQGARSAYRGIFLRRDGELLRSMAASPATILRARALAIVASSQLIPMFWVSAFANVRMLRGDMHGALLYLLVISAGSLAAVTAIVAMLGAIRLLGLARAALVGRVVAMVALGALATAHFWTRNLDVAPAVRRFQDLLQWAMRGSPSETTAYSIAAALGAVTGLIVLPRVLGSALDLAWTATRAGAGKTQPYGSPARSVLARLVIKEWRLMARDGSLVPQVLASAALTSLTVLFITQSRGAGGEIAVRCMAPVALGGLASDLLWVTSTRSETRWIDGFAAKPARLAFAKVVAAVAAPAALALVLAGVMSVLYGAVVALATACAAGVNCSLAVVLNGLFPQKAGGRSLMTRRRQQRAVAFAEVIGMAAFSVAALIAPAAFIAFVGAVCVAFIAVRAAVKRAPRTSSVDDVRGQEVQATR